MRPITGYDPKLLHRMLQEMLIIRRFEEKAGQLYGQRKIGGFCHLYNGQEAVAVGTILPLDLKMDYVLTGYRDHAHALVCGMSPEVIMAELYGRKTGCSRGKGGSMHMFDAEKHMLGGNGIVGGQIPVATGVALASRYRKEKGVTLCYFGDGAIHQGAFHESLNLAKIWKLPVVYICENNQYGMGTEFSRVSSVTDFSLMADSYGLKGWQVDGMDVIAVYEEIQKAIEMGRNESMATLLEIKTYRYKGHSMSDPAKYRSKEDLESFKAIDPIIMLKEAMIEGGHLTADDYVAMDKEIKVRVQASVKFAEESPEPEAQSLYEDILA